MVVALLLAALAHSASPVATVELADRSIRVRDLATTRAHGDAIIGVLPDGRTQIEVDEATARRLVRNRLPATRFELNFADSIVLSAPPQQKRLGTCFKAVRAIPKGAAITSEDTEKTQCHGERFVALVGFDKNTAAPTSRRAIAEGTYLGAIQPVNGRRVTKGNTMTLVTGGAGVTIARSVTPLQPGHEGGAVFVQTQDGEVFAAPVSRLREGEAQ